MSILQRLLFGFAVFAITGLTISTVTLAMDDDPPPAVQPARAKAVQVQPKVAPAQPAQPGIGRVTAARMATLEEEFEMLEAHRDVKKAIVKAAEVAVRATKASYELIAKGPTVYPQQEVDKAKFALEAAEAQLDIRMAELKEVEVKIKHAKKRLDQAKVAPDPRLPAPKVDRKAVDPPPPSPDAGTTPAGQKAVLELKKKILVLEAGADDTKAAVAKAVAEVRAAKAELKLFDPKFADTPVFAQAREKVEKAKAAFEKLAAEHIASADELARVKVKLMEIEK